MKLNRREFSKSISLAPAAFPYISKLRDDKPNILFIWTDEQRADTMSAYGNHKIHSPNLNKLSDESVIYQNAYVSQPVCTPSRSTVLTGYYPHQNTCTQNNIPLPQEIKCLPELISDSDYRTAYMGKWHLGDEIFAQHGFEEWIGIEDGYRSYYSESKDKNEKSDYCKYLLDLGLKPDRENGTFSRGFAARQPLERCKPKFLETKACDFLQRNQKNPFILHINFLEPHMPFYGPLDDRHQPDEIELPKNFLDELNDNEPLRYRLLRERYRQKGFEGHDLLTEQGWRKLISQYWGLVTQVDLSVGAILLKLESLGLSDNTIVVYTSDHGDMMGSHQLLAKTVMYEESVKVPWLMRIPKQGKKQQRVQNRTSHIDMIPTLLDLLNKPIPEELSGKSLVSSMQKNQFSQNPINIEWNPAIGSNNKTPISIPNISKEERDRVHMASIRTAISQDGWKLCWCDKDKSQLFNLNKDPYETTNLYGKPETEKITTKLQAQIHQWQEKTNDTITL
jgi:arylsulfatase A-like enzyme